MTPNLDIKPDIKISVIAGAFVGSAGVGTQTTTATIKIPTPTTIPILTFFELLAACECAPQIYSPFSSL